MDDKSIDKVYLDFKENKYRSKYLKYKQKYFDLKSESEKMIETLNKTYIRLGKSKYGGIGVVAIRDIPKNTVLFRNDNDNEYNLMKYKELKKLHPNIRKMVEDFFLVNNKYYYFNKEMKFNDDDVFPVPKKGITNLDMSHFLNHNQENPNVEPFFVEGKIWNNFKTIKNVKIGEELTFNYNI